MVLYAVMISGEDGRETFSNTNFSQKSWNFKWFLNSGLSGKKVYLISLIECLEKLIWCQLFLNRLLYYFVVNAWLCKIYAIHAQYQTIRSAHLQDADFQSFQNAERDGV